MLEEPELLILDEPTNHLDIDTKNIVEDVFEAYDGPIIFISHDRYFINKVATKIISIRDGILEVHDGNYSEYIEHLNSLIETKKNTPKLQPSKFENKEKQLKKLVKQIDDLDIKLDLLKQQLYLADIYTDRLKFDEKTNEIHETEKVIESLYKEIETLSD